jgi:hypothetical protein
MTRDILDAGDEKLPYVLTIGKPRRMLSWGFVTTEPAADLLTADLLRGGRGWLVGYR